MTTVIPVAVIGAGHMGRHHARVYSEMPGARLVAVVDAQAERAAEIAGKYGAAALTSIEQLPAEVRAATVAVPTVHHVAVAEALLARGVAVLVEKPIAPTVADARRLLESARLRNGLLAVGHTERFNPAVRALQRYEIAPKFIETERVSPFTFRSADIGVVADMMIHDIDIVLHLARQREYQVEAVGVRVLGASEDVANARVRFANGTVASLTASRLALKTDRRIRIFCPTAYLSMDYQRKSGVAIKLADNVDLIRLTRERHFEDLSQMATMDFGSMVRIEPIVVDDVEPLQAEIDAFLSAIRTGGEPAVSAEEGFAAVEMAERISEAIRRQEFGSDLMGAE